MTGAVNFLNYAIYASGVAYFNAQQQLSIQRELHKHQNKHIVRVFYYNGVCVCVCGKSSGVHSLLELSGNIASVRSKVYILISTLNL